MVKWRNTLNKLVSLKLRMPSIEQCLKTTKKGCMIFILKHYKMSIIIQQKCNKSKRITRNFIVILVLFKLRILIWNKEFKNWMRSVDNGNLSTKEHINNLYTI